MSAGAIEDVVSRFLRAYLAGDAGALAYLVPAGVRIGALGQRHELVDVTSLGAGGAGGGAGARGAGDGPRAGRGDGRDVRAALPAAAGARGPLAGGRGQYDDPEGGLRRDAQVRDRRGGDGVLVGADGACGAGAAG